jgi:SAM-dependent methyltransferase
VTGAPDIKEEVRRFYDQVGWSRVGECCFQNARYEDLRPVSREYIHRCHARVARHLNPSGRYFLDAGSGPIQYPEYVGYSQGFELRVCADLSHVALQEARKRIGSHGRFVVADIAHLPFRTDSFEATVSLHTIHHVPEHEQLRAYQELHRTLAPGASAVIVNGWRSSSLMKLAAPLMRLIQAALTIYRRLRGGGEGRERTTQAGAAELEESGTFVARRDVAWVEREIGGRMPIEILTWRSVRTAFLRTVVHPRLGGRWLLRVIYMLEERFPNFFGRHGQYPLIVLRKSRAGR